MLEDLEEEFFEFEEAPFFDELVKKWKEENKAHRWKA